MFYSDINALFIAIPKTAGTSLTSALNSISLDGYKHEEKTKNTPAGERGKIVHATAYEYLSKGIITQSQYDKAFKFAVFRNPIDRLASMHRYLVSKGLIPECTTEKFFLEWLPETFQNSNSKFNYFTLPQHEYVYVNKKNVTNQILHYERLKEDIQDLEKNLNINLYLKNLNVTNKKDYPNIYNNKNIINMIETLYLKDFIVGGY